MTARLANATSAHRTPYLRLSVSSWFMIIIAI